MKQIYPDLWQSTLFKSGMLNSYAYLLLHPDGNILFYNTNHPTDLDHIEKLGGIKYQLLTHRDEASASLLRVRKRFNSSLVFSEAEAEAISKYAQADQFFNACDHQFEHIQVLHTPGHTNGSVCFTYQSPHGKTYLFSGDTFFQWNGKWATLVLETSGGNKSALIESLQKIRNIKPDVVMSSGFVGGIGIAELSAEDWINAINTEISTLT